MKPRALDHKRFSKNFVDELKASVKRDEYGPYVKIEATAGLSAAKKLHDWLGRAIAHIEDKPMRHAREER